MRALVAAVFTAVLAGVAPASVIVNGSFENGSSPPGSGFTNLSSGSTAITGWTVGGGGVDWVHNSYWQSSDGVRSVDLSGGAAGSLSQTFTTVAGQTYRVSFDLAGNREGGNVTKSLSVQATGNASQLYSFNTTGFTNANMGWSGRTYLFTATGGSTTLTFTSNEANAYGPALDNVLVDAVPEPVSLVLFGGLVVGGVAVARRRMAAKA